MIFERKKYLDELIAGRGNGLVKIITGVRRCGKSFLLFDIWHNWLFIILPDFQTDTIMAV